MFEWCFENTPVRLKLVVTAGSAAGWDEV